MEANEPRGSIAIRIVVASDIRLYRDALERAFREANGIDLVGAASGGEDTLKHVERLTPDILILDMKMFDAFAVEMQL
jgi:chemotaxis response regulator CheB